LPDRICHHHYSSLSASYEERKAKVDAYKRRLEEERLKRGEEEKRRREAEDRRIEASKVNVFLLGLVLYTVIVARAAVNLCFPGQKCVF
jgi:hypothetical protein